MSMANSVSRKKQFFLFSKNNSLLIKTKTVFRLQVFLLKVKESYRSQPLSLLAELGFCFIFKL